MNDDTDTPAAGSPDGSLPGGPDAFAAAAGTGPAAAARSAEGSRDAADGGPGGAASVPWGTVFQAAGVAMYLTDDAGRIVDANAAFCALLDCPREDLIGRRLDALLPPAEAERTQAHRTRADHSQPGTAGPAEGRTAPCRTGRRRDGSTLEVSTSTSPIAAPGGRSLVLGTATDITARRAGERRARASEQRLRQAQQIASMGYWRYDPDSGRVECSDGIFHIFGRPRQDPLPLETVLGWLDPANRILMRDLLGATLADGRRRMFTCRALHPEDGRRVLEGECMAERAADGTVVTLVGVVHDVTDRETGRAALDTAQARLAESERLLLRAQEVARLGHWRVTVGDRLVTWSDSNYRLCGLQPGEPMTVERALSLIHPDDREAVSGQIRAALAERRDRVEMDYRLIAADGTLRFVHTSAAVELDADGRPVAVFGVTQDVTETRRIEQELRRQKQEAEAANKAKSDFLANMSHELRTPLNAILGFSELIKEELFGPVGTPRYRDYAQSIHDSGSHLLELIGDILDMSKIEAGRLELERRPIAVAPVLRHAMRLLNLKAEQARLRLDLAVPEDCRALADPRALKQVAINLLSNAIKFTLPGGTVSVSCSVDDGRLVLSFADTGIGIDPADIDHILEPFGQVRSPLIRSQKGTGLGLPLSRRLIGLMGGTLEIDSTPGSGTTARIALPAATDDGDG